MDFKLDPIFLKRRIHELDLKIWWVADQINVDRKTVSRWINGKVESIQKQNLNRLSEVLQCKPSQLILKTQNSPTASQKIIARAAVELSKSSILEALGPLEEWGTIESLIKSNLSIDLPLVTLGDLYEKLTIAAWRQNKIEEATLYNKRTLEIAEKLKNSTLKYNALLSSANLEYWRGKISNSILILEECLQNKKHLQPAKLAAAYSNLGATLFEIGSLKSGEKHLRKSIELFEKLDLPFNLAIAWTHITSIMIIKKRYPEAFAANKRAFSYSTISRYKRGQAYCSLQLGEIHALKGNSQLAISFLRKGNLGFSKLRIKEGPNHEITGRVLRILKKYEAAEKMIRKGLIYSEAFPLERAFLLRELEIVIFAQRPDSKKEIEAINKEYLGILEKCGINNL